MAGQIRRLSSAEAMKQATALAKDLEAKYNLEDIDVYDKENGIVQIFAISDDFIDMDPNMLTEAYVPQNIKEFAKRKGVSRLVNTVAGWAEKVGARITGGTAIGKYYNTLILDLGYQTGDIRINCDEETVELYDEPVNSFAEFKNVFMEEETRKQIEHDEETLRRERGLEETAAYIAETIKLGLMLNEELCEKGQRYIKARQAAGEKSSAYLSGRAVRVCKGQIEWPKKGKNKK